MTCLVLQTCCHIDNIDIFVLILVRFSVLALFALQDLEGNFSPNLDCLVTHGDPNTIRHPTVVLFADILWHKVASFKFVVSKLFSVFILIVFIFGQAVLLRHNTEQAPEEEYAMFACRVVNYVGSLSKLVFSRLAP